MYRKLTPEMLSPYIQIQHKQRQDLIQGMKNQLAQLMQLEGVFVSRNQEIVNIENRYVRVLDQMERLESQFATSINLKRKQMGNMTIDIISLEGECKMLRDKLTANRTSRNPTKELLNAKNRELEEVLARNVEMEHENRKFVQANILTSQMNKELAEKSDHLVLEKRMFVNKLAENTEILESKQMQRQQIQTDNLVNQQLQLQLQQQLVSKRRQIQTKFSNLRQLQAKTLRAESENQQLKAKSHKLSESVSWKQQQQQRLASQLGILEYNNRENQSIIRQLETSVRSIDTESAYETSKNLQLKSGIHIQESRNRLTSEQISKYQAQKQNAETNNKQNQRALLYCMSCDQKIRSILDREALIKRLLTEINDQQ